MHNVEHVITGDKLVITVDISEKAISAAPPSNSGKTVLVGTTGGAVAIARPAGSPPVTFALNVMAKK